MVGFAAAAPVLWPVAPDWSASVRERLGWVTEVLPGLDGQAQKRALRPYAPAREFAFRVLSEGAERRLVDGLLAAQGAALWALPVWHDGQGLAAPVAAGATTVPCATAGYDFAADRRAVLWRSATEWELVTVAAIAADTLTLAAPLAAGWARGTRLLPVREARLLQPAVAGMWHDNGGELALTFRVAEPCDWTAALPAATYRGFPVLEAEPERGDDLAHSYVRELAEVDVDTGPAHYFDGPGVAFRRTPQAWLLHGRAAAADFRALLYGLQGRAATLWVPSGLADLSLAAPLAADGTALVVAWSGYALFGVGRANRRDLRLALAGGAVLYRRVLAAVDNGDGTETLTLDSAPGVALSVAGVRRISFLALSEAATDTVELEHVTDADGITRAALTFQGVVENV